ncbi:MAG: hypothetical protein M1824_006512 [Vezdaea acicularis]|nr:MAG: hypothetical protein M1824_006512 [Vezdaea acicularis]
MTAEPVNAHSGDVPWFAQELTDINQPARDLFEKYSGIAADKVIPHVLSIEENATTPPLKLKPDDLQRNRAWQIWPYPCIGQFRFLDLSISLSPAYPDVLQRLKDSTTSQPPRTLLDMGCCFGQDIRRLVLDGVDSSQLYGSDLRREFMELGYDLFLDRESLKSKFLVGDIFADKGGLDQLDCKIDIIHAASFLHLFDRANQIAACKRLVRILRAEAGSMILGRQAGNIRPGEYPRRDHPNETRYRHDASSFEKMWNEIGEETGTQWKVKADLTEAFGPYSKKNKLDLWNDPGTRRLTFVVTRL